ncbi:hypothetical protein [Streptomyces cyaneofuscatus]
MDEQPSWITGGDEKASRTPQGEADDGRTDEDDDETSRGRLEDADDEWDD